MTLPVSPNTISASQANVELGFASTALLGFNDPAVRALAGRPTPFSLISLGDLRGKSNTATAAQIISQIYATPTIRNAFISNFKLTGFETSTLVNIDHNDGGQNYNTLVTYTNNAMNYSGFAGTAAGNTSYTTIVMQSLGPGSGSGSVTLSINGVPRTVNLVSDHPGIPGKIMRYYAQIPMSVTAITSMVITMTKGGDNWHATNEFFILPGQWAPTQSSIVGSGVSDSVNFSVQPNDLLFAVNSIQMDGPFDNLALSGAAMTKVLDRDIWWYTSSENQLFRAIATGTATLTNTRISGWYQSGGKEPGPPVYQESNFYGSASLFRHV